MILAASAPVSPCQMPRPTNIQIIPKTGKVALNTSYTRDQMQGTKINTINPYGFDKKTHTNGYMSGELKSYSSVKLDYTIAKNGGVCLFYDQIKVTFEINPTIVIAKELADDLDKCLYRAVYEHEMKHVTTDRRVINKSANAIGQALMNGLSSRGFMVGPIAQEDAEAVAERMKETAAQLIDFEYKKLEIDRQEQQQAVDSLEEYERVGNLCQKRLRFEK